MTPIPIFVTLIGIGQIGLLYPLSPPPRPEGLSANFNTLQCVVIANYATK